MSGQYTIALIIALLFTLVATASRIISIKKRNRRFAVRPTNRLRNEKGFFNTLIQDMLKKEEEDQFFKYTRMTKNQFIYLHKLIEPFLKRDLKKISYFIRTTTDNDFTVSL